MRARLLQFHRRGGDDWLEVKFPFEYYFRMATTLRLLCRFSLFWDLSYIIQ